MHGALWCPQINELNQNNAVSGSNKFRFSKSMAAGCGGGRAEWAGSKGGGGEGEEGVRAGEGS